MKASAFLAMLLAAIASFRICSTYKVFNHTIDEPDHLAAGMEWLNTGKYRYEDQHPPLARIFGAVGPFLAGERWHSGPDSYGEGYRILGHGTHYDRVLALGRAGILPFFWIACVVVYLWGYRAGGPVAAVSGTLIFTTIPPVLAHAGLLTTDMAVACWTGAAALAALWWAEKPERPRTWILGLVTGLACLSKFSALLFLPAVWLALYLGYRHPRKAARGWVSHGRELIVALGIASLVIWAGYGFSFARVEFLHLRLPAPRFFSGIHAVWQHNRAGHPSYLLGRRSPHGFWYYYPVVLAVKTPHALLLLGLGALALRLRQAVAPLAFCGAILAVALISRIDIGVRHVLPIYLGLAVAGGTVAARAWQASGRSGMLAKTGIALLLAWQVVSGVRQHPDYLAYTNEIAGDHPERILADSDLDWGQDMKRLGDYLAQAGAARVAFTPFNRTYLVAGHPLPPVTPIDSERPSPGWNAVSISLWKIFGEPAWVDRVPPGHLVGKSILVWYFPE